MLTDYTTPDDIRSVLGVTADELEDETLALETWDNLLMFELEDVHAGLPAGYAAVVATEAATRTAVQSKLYRATRMYATLAVANGLTASLPMFGPKDISDGKATVSRFADSPYKPVVAEIRKQYEAARTRLKQAWAEMSASTATVTARPYFGVAKPTTDPVTG